MKLKITLILAYVMIMLDSCTLYTPGSVQTPIFRNKGEVQAGVMDGFSGTDISLAAAPTKHIGAFASYNFFNSTDSSEIFNKNQFEIATGYYFFNKPNMTVEYYLGYTGGKLIDNTLDHSTLAVTDSLSVNYSAIFFQPDIGLTTKVGEFAFTPRINYYFLNSPQHNPYHFFAFQPSLNFGFGYKYVYFYVNQSLLFNISNPKKDLSWFTLMPYNLNVGIRIKLFRIFDESKMY